MPSKTKIIKALLKNRGGLQNATESGLMKIWGLLDVETQNAYLETVKDVPAEKKGTTNARSFGSRKKSL